MITLQKETCEKYNSAYLPVNEEDIVIFVGESFLDLPIIGCRITDFTEEGKEFPRWYISAGMVGEDTQEQALSVKEIIAKIPQIQHLLALDLGFNFILDEENEEDVWFEND